MFCSPPVRTSAQLGAGSVKIIRLAFQVTTVSQQKQHPPFRLYFHSARNWSTSFPTYHTASRLVRPVRRNTTDPISEQKNQREKHSIHGEDEQRNTNAEEIRRPKTQDWQKRDGRSERQQRWNANPVRAPEPQQRNREGPKQDYWQPEK
jgi:hypothetical protein